MKVEIYADLLFINEATEQFTKRLERLKKAKVLTPHYAELRVLAARQNCAELNASIVNHLVKPEMDAAYKLEQEFVAKTAKLAATKDKKTKRAIEVIQNVCNLKSCGGARTRRHITR